MNSTLSDLSASALRKLSILEINKFIVALEYGTTLSDLSEMRSYLKMVLEELSRKENEEFSRVLGKYLPKDLHNEFLSLPKSE